MIPGMWNCVLLEWPTHNLLHESWTSFHLSWTTCRRGAAAGGLHSGQQVQASLWQASGRLWSSWPGQQSFRGSLRRTGQELEVSESAFNAWGRQLRRRGSAEFLEGIGAHMMYTITRGPSKLVTQRRTGEWMWPLPKGWCNVTSGCFWLKKAKVSGLFHKVKCFTAGLHRAYKRVIFPFLPQVTLSRSRASSATWNWSRRPGSRQSEYVYFVFLFNVYFFFLRVALGVLLFEQRELKILSTWTASAII